MLLDGAREEAEISQMTDADPVSQSIEHLIIASSLV